MPRERGSRSATKDHACADSKKDRVSGSKKWRRVILRTLFGLLLACALLLTVALYVAFSSGAIWRSANESDAVGMLSHINLLEARYAANHPEKGFACTLRLLGSEHVEDSTHFPEDFFATGEDSGYRFTFAECRASATGRVEHYSITAEPTNHGVTGVRAFCMDEARSFWYDRRGSGTNCLLSRVPIV